WSLGARRELVLQPYVRERAAHHHLVVAAARAVRVEVDRLDAMADEILTGGTRLPDGPRRRDVVGRDAVAQEAQHPGAADVAHRPRLRRHAVEIRRAADVGGRRLPRKAVALGHRQAAPALVAVEHLRIAL